MSPDVMLAARYTSGRATSDMALPALALQILTAFLSRCVQLRRYRLKRIAKPGQCGSTMQLQPARPAVTGLPHAYEIGDDMALPVEAVTKVLAPASRIAALNTVLKILDTWGVGPTGRDAILGLDQPELEQLLKPGSDEAWRAETLERLSYVLNIYASLQVLLRIPERADKWPSQPNTAPLFSGRSALDLMTSGSIDDLEAVAGYLMAQASDGSMA